MNNYSKGYEDITVEILDYNKNWAKTAWEAYRMTWKDLQEVSYDSKNPVVVNAIKDIMYNRALPTPKEASTIYFRINNISRVCLAQITRGRNWWFNVESQMPAPVSHNVLIPRNIAENEKYMEKVTKLVEQSQELYDYLISEGLPPQDCRYLLLHGQTTSLVCHTQLPVFVNTFGTRCENGLADEINYVFRLVRREFFSQLESDLYNGEIDDLTYFYYAKMISGADCMGAKNKVCVNYDKVFGNTGRFPSANETIQKNTDNALYDFKKSAWYLELLDLDQDLLFPGENEMIERWKSDEA